MFFLKKIFPALFLALFFTACTTVPPEPVAKSTPAVRARGEELAKLLETLPFRATVLEFSTLLLPDEAAADLLCSKIKELGFNHLLIRLSSLDEIRSHELRMLIDAANRQSLLLEPLLLQTDFVTRHRGNAFKRMFLAESPTLIDAVRELVIRNQRAPENQKIAGIAVSIAPHLFTENNPNRPQGLLYAWDPARFGAGLDNDQIIRQTFRMLSDIEAQCAPLPLIVGVPDFYHELAESQKISKGTLSDFFNLSPRHPIIMLENSGNKPSELVNTVQTELNCPKARGRLVIGINLAEHTAVNTGALRRRDWNDFLRSLRYAVTQFQKCKNFNGLVLGPFSMIETLQQEE